MSNETDKEKAQTFIGCICFIVLCSIAIISVSAAIMAVRWVF